MQQEQLYTVKQMAKILGISESQANRYIYGFYINSKTKTRAYYYPDRKGIEPTSGTGVKNKPFLYSLESFKQYASGSL